VEGEHLFSGSALGRVGTAGDLRLPPFVLAVLARRGNGRRVVFGAHESAPCLTAFDRAHLRALGGEIERLRQRDEASGGDPARHAARARRAFGFSEEAEVTEDGKVALPPFLRARSGMGRWALFVGAGPEVEIWDAARALASDDPALRALAQFRLAEVEETG
jgi:DNA-binding transcriptional regulator/RsmH inhibitor MraZ